MKFQAINKQQGIGLIEVLITILVIAIGLLGLAGMQAQSMKSTYQSGQRSQAIWMAQELAERMRANPSAVSNQHYLNAINTVRAEITANPGSDKPCSTPSPACNASICNEEQLARYDVWELFCADTSTTPLPRVNPYLVCTPASCADGSDLHITLEWEEAQTNLQRTTKTTGSGSDNPTVELIIRLEG
ncbi:type IV pilus modification protein PilV [Spartinivicinus poritis]|uniref:Type IV pilus modification protein PilV n=1 Tax=Spartinivicinus poritis TaxID=2994640 RepID=A0ABT5U2F1_9GAMM|nr:type IV pilus modification protein PilV [Spartinivicinus sp. A2-2]MDE1460533.1 type IV pilus modification protein PilV [Spartinivicinus sp. A2-2]